MGRRGAGEQSKLWSELKRGNRIGRLDPGEDLSDADLGDGDGHLDRHVGSNAEAAILVGDLSLGMRVGCGNNAAKHEQRDTQHGEENSRRPLAA